MTPEHVAGACRTRCRSHARRPDAGKHTEIYLPQQAIVVFDGDTPMFISHISSGELEPPGDDFSKGKEWCEEVTIDPGENGNVDGTEPLKKGVCGNAWTPGGVYEYYRKVEGVAREPPRRDAQPRLLQLRHRRARRLRGARRTRRRTAASASPTRSPTHFQSLVNIGEQVFVWDGIEEPEAYGAQSGLWDWADPNYTTTTSTTTTTTLPPTTVGPTTTAPPPPAPTPATTTTAPPPAGRGHHHHHDRPARLILSTVVR